MRKAIFVAIAVLVAGTLSAQQQLSNPTVLGSSSGPFDSTWDYPNMFDGNACTDYASDGAGTSTRLDFDFGSATYIAQVVWQDRNASGGANGTCSEGTSDKVNSYDLVFSDTSDFSVVLYTEHVTAGSTLPDIQTTSINGGAGVTAQYVRWQVTGTAGSNPGAAEFSFYTNTADVSVSKTTTTTGPYFSGQQVSYNIVASNGGPSDADVTVTDALPAGETLVSATPSQGSPCTGTTTINCDLGTINSGNNASVALTVTLTGTGSISNTASVSLASGTMNTDGNATSTATITVLPPSSSIPTVSGGMLALMALGLALAAGVALKR